jgi:protein-S-isoprenylcysteine O-methyltransferase Ste14
MRVEDGMLVARFGEQFTAYRNNVPRLVPFLK